MTVSVPKSEELPGETVSGLGLPIPGCVGVLRIRGEPSELPACFPAVMAASIRGVVVSASCVNVFVCVCLPLSPSSVQVSRLFLQWLSSIPLYRPRQEPPPQEFQEPVGERLALASLHGRRWVMELERPQVGNTAR